jgi:hypothetical protein
MKRNVRKIAVIVLVVALISALTMAAYASAYQIVFRTNVSFGSFSKIDESRIKGNSTPMTIQINRNDIVNYYHARAIACDYYSNNEINVTMHNGQLVDHVSIYGGTTVYGIANDAFNSGPGYAVISLKTNGPSATVSGYWAPDAAQEFAFATP